MNNVILQSPNLITRMLFDRYYGGNAHAKYGGTDYCHVDFHIEFQLSDGPDQIQRFAESVDEVYTENFLPIYNTDSDVPSIFRPKLASTDEVDSWLDVEVDRSLSTGSITRLRQLHFNLCILGQWPSQIRNLPTINGNVVEVMQTAYEQCFTLELTLARIQSSADGDIYYRVCERLHGVYPNS